MTVSYTHLIFSGSLQIEKQRNSGLIKHPNPVLTQAVYKRQMFESIGGKESFLYQINEDIARLIIAGLLILIMPLFFCLLYTSRCV